MSRKRKSIEFDSIVEQIRGMKKQGRTKYWWIKWADCIEDAKTAMTWEPDKFIGDRSLIQEYEDNDKKGWCWQWESKGDEDAVEPKGWHPFDPEAQQKVEKAFHTWIESSSWAASEVLTEVQYSIEKRL